ncbi:MAG: glycosyltransferase, partial [Candidatus Bathyarchaeia archaeon]
NVIMLYGLILLYSYLSRIFRSHFLPKICITVHGFSFPVDRIFQNMLSKFHYIIVHSDFAREALIKCGLPPSKIRVIPHGIPIFNKIRRNYGREKEVKVVIFGFIHENKGHDIAIKALQFLPRHYKLLICGSPRIRAHYPYFYKLKAMVSALGLNDRVKFLGFIPNERLQEIMKECDCAIYPYLWPDNWIESSGALGIPISYGLPVIASDTAVFKEIYNKYKCLRLVKRGDPQDLASAIRQVVEDEKFRKELLDNMSTFQEAASWKKVADLTLNTYLELIVDHPDYIYEDESQRSRLTWLRSQCQGKILEVGCATGYVTTYVGAICGVDIRPDRLFLTKRKYPQIEFILSNATRLPFKDSSFDTVLLPDILEHMNFKVAAKAIREAIRVSKRLVVITLPRAEHQSYKTDTVTGRLNPEHLWDPTEGKIKDLFRDYKYELHTSSDGKFWLVKVILDKGRNIK